jgi:hypothetical protein
MTMGALIHVAMFIGALIAFIAWAIAGLCALNVAELAPKGWKLAAYFDLGRWKFADLESRLGPSVVPHLARYKRAFRVFFATIGTMLVVSLSSLFVKSA